MKAPFTVGVDPTLSTIHNKDHIVLPLNVTGTNPLLLMQDTQQVIYIFWKHPDITWYHFQPELVWRKVDNTGSVKEVIVDDKFQFYNSSILHYIFPMRN